MSKKIFQCKSLEVLKKGSFTVEGAVIYPMFFVLILMVVQLAVSLYQEVKEEYEPVVIESMWEVQDFYNYNHISKTNKEENHISE